MSISILRLGQVENRTGLKRSSIYERIKGGQFPRPVKLGRRAVGWVASDVDATLAAVVAGLAPADIAALVEKLESSKKSSV